MTNIRLPIQQEACYCCLQAGGESCPVRAKTHRSDCRNTLFGSIIFPSRKNLAISYQPTQTFVNV